MKAKSERLIELNALLDMDHKENEIVEGEVKTLAKDSERTRNVVTR